MTITVLDGNALNPGDLDYSVLEKFGKLNVYPRTAPQDVIPRISDSEAVLLNKINITEEILSACPSLRYIGIQATGYNVVDIEACKKHGITVTNVPFYSTDGVAQLTFSFITEFASRACLHSEDVMNGGWTQSPDFCYWKAPITELNGKTLGIFGFGNIGHAVEKIARAFGMKTIICTRTPRTEIENPVDFDTLLKESDFLTLHAPLTDKTKGIINRETLSRMKKSAFLINTARGAFVDEEALVEALKNRTISGYAADVISEEPMKRTCPLLKAPHDKIILTPHIAWAAVETRQRLLNEVVKNLEAWINGSPRNVVS
ncbi:MAG: D-2-hydroxyacid dehydrogenase [Treponema sp.]|nr:D-2-hydroxyacid dehydrogenase [Treponema sp.]